MLRLCLLLVLTSTRISAEVFDCEKRDDRNITLPDIPDEFFDPSYVLRTIIDEEETSDTTRTFMTTEEEILYIFSSSVQPKCRGDIISIEYCYNAEPMQNRINGTRSAFDIIFLRREDAVFVVDNRHTVITVLRREICDREPRETYVICCDTYTLPSASKMPILLSSFSYGVVAKDVKLLAFSSSQEDFHFPQFQLQETTEEVFTRITIDIPSEQVTDESLLLLRFVIEQPPPTTQPRASDQTSGSQTAMSPLTTTLDAAGDGSPPTQQNASSLSPPSSSVGAAVGGAVAGVVAVMGAVGIVAFVACIIVGKQRQMKSSTTGNQKRDTLYVESDTSAPVYAGIGPEVTGRKLSTENQTENLQTNDYAECGATGYEVPVVKVKHFEATSNPTYNGTTPIASSSAAKHFEAIGNQMYNESGKPFQAIENQVYNASETAWNHEDIYMVPARDETSLYAQLQDIRIMDLNRNTIQLGGELGSGQFGVVYKGVLHGEGDEEKEVAVKTLKEGSGEEDRVKFLQEAAIMGQFKHHNVVTMYGVVITGEPILLVLELLKQGDLREHLHQMRSNDIDPHTLLSYCRQVASGMAYLSNKAFVHRDLAARNILVSDEDICKIADFGMSRDLADESYYISHGGKIPVKWTAPEALHYKKYSTASDVWSYGALMYEIWSVGHKPYETLTNIQVMKKVDTGYRLPPPPGCPRAIYNVMIQCWHPKTSNRPTFSDITRQLSLPDPKLLKWSEEDKAVHPEAAKLGADLLSAQELYKDLQTLYQKHS